MFYSISRTGLRLMYHYTVGAGETFYNSLRFEGYMVVIHFTPLTWRHFGSVREAQWDARKEGFGATFQRKVKPVRICRLACPGGLFHWDI